MTSTTKIKKRVLRRQRYADHYVHLDHFASTGRRGWLAQLDDERTLRVRRIRKRALILLIPAFRGLAREAAKTKAAFQRMVQALSRPTPEENR